MAYSLDFRKQVLSIKSKEKLSIRITASRFGIASTTVVRWLNKIETNYRSNSGALKIDMDLLKKDVEQYPDAYQYERAARLGVSNSCVLYALRRLKISYKKNSASPQSRRRIATVISGKNNKI